MYIRHTLKELQKSFNRIDELIGLFQDKWRTAIYPYAFFVFLLHNIEEQ